ncbi:hypothetical protein ABZ714_05600 [Streptomyces sp. NPDC006798]|uniref:hypothetical protein n=1 Tax=Streptomyces sp. NPDC006798 TaxID=3155462 RepID=UPI0033F13B62
MEGRGHGPAVRGTASFVFHFGFVRDGVPVFSVERKWGIRDRYPVRIQDPDPDRGLVLSTAVAPDALQSR